jgi:hypothetical protein
MGQGRRRLRRPDGFHDQPAAIGRGIQENHPVESGDFARQLRQKL